MRDSVTVVRRDGTARTYAATLDRVEVRAGLATHAHIWLEDLDPGRELRRVAELIREMASPEALPRDGLERLVRALVEE